MSGYVKRQVYRCALVALCAGVLWFFGWRFASGVATGIALAMAVITFDECREEQ